MEESVLVLAVESVLLLALVLAALALVLVELVLVWETSVLELVCGTEQQ